LDAQLSQWQPHYSLLSVVRQMHAEFQLSPPIPENYFKLQASSEVSAVSEAPKVEEVPVMVNDAAQLQPVEMRSEQERRALVESEMEQQTQTRLRESKDALLSSLASISLTELRKLNDDDEYRRDSLLTSHASIKLLKQKESLEDQALRTANENIKLAEQLESDAQVYAETVHPRFEELREKAGPLAERLE